MRWYGLQTRGGGFVSAGRVFELHKFLSSSWSYFSLRAAYIEYIILVSYVYIDISRGSVVRHDLVMRIILIS
jgi:hypothetical protein